LIEKKQIEDKVFLDTNILIYAYSIDEPKKKEKVEHILKNIKNIIISTQVINEFINVMLRKQKLKPDLLNNLINELYNNFEISPIDLIIIQKAINLTIDYKYSYFDSLMISSALINNCKILFTEDMHHNHNFENKLLIINPFIKID